MNENKVTMGLKETKEAVDFAVALGTGLEAALSDKQITLSDIPVFFPSFLKLVPAVEGAEQIPLEFKLATQEEVDELKSYLKEKLDLQDDQMEKFIEDAFGLVLTVWSIVNTYFIKKEATENSVEESKDDVVPEAPAVE